MIILFLITGIFLILFLGFLFAVGGGILGWTFDEVVPELSNLGEVDEGLNMTEWAGYTIVPLNSIVQNLPWVFGLVYTMMLIVCIVAVVGFRAMPNRWLLGFFFACVLVLLLGSIYMSNIYEDIATGSDELALKLQDATILHFMMLHSPLILTAIAFISGIILFSGMVQEDFI